MKQIILNILIIIAVVLSSWLFFKREKVTLDSQQPKLQIVTSLYPIYFFTARIVKDKAQVTNLAANGDPHDFEPVTGDLRLINSANLVIGNGAGLETWIETLDSQTPILLSALTIANIEDHDHELDPHVWLDPNLAIQQIRIVADTISKLDEKNRDFYQKNAQQLISELDQLNREFTTNLQSCKQNQIITAHAAFAYMARRYKFEQLSIQGLNHDEEVSARQLTELARLARDKQIKYILFESLLSPKLAQTLAQEVDVNVLPFDPLESIGVEDRKRGADYFSVQRQNLANLKLALECNN